MLGERLDVADIVSELDIFVLPSLHEGMPNALLEAMAAGIPVVTTGVGGTVEIVTDEETGLVVPPADVEELVAALTRLGGDADLRRRLGRAGQASVLAGFGSLEAEVDALESAFLEALDGGSGL